LPTDQFARFFSPAFRDTQGGPFASAERQDLANVSNWAAAHSIRIFARLLMAALAARRIRITAESLNLARPMIIAFLPIYMASSRVMESSQPFVTSRSFNPHRRIVGGLSDGKRHAARKPPVQSGTSFGSAIRRLLRGLVPPRNPHSERAAPLDHSVGHGDPRLEEEFRYEVSLGRPIRRRRHR